MLKGDNPNMKDIAVWLLMLRRWAAAQTLDSHMFGPLPATVPGNTEDDRATHRRDMKRILFAAVDNKALYGDLSDIASTCEAPDLIAHIKQNWLSGRHVLTVSQV